MPFVSPRARITALTALAVSILVTVGTVSAPAFADSMPAAGVVETVTTDPLPTVQIDGIVWTQLIVGNTVYVGGQFANARPAGAAAGTNQTPRANILAYNLTTGALITSFAPTVNGVVYALAASPDGSRLYAGGTFTTINGSARYRIAAFDTASGGLISTFRPSVNSTVQAIAATNSTVYFGGNFTSVAGSVRTRVAAVAASNAALLPFTATADGGRVRGLTISPDQSRVVVAGSFTTLNGSSNPGFGMGAVDATTGGLLPWAVNNRVRNAGANAAIYSLTSDGTSVYGTGYKYSGGGVAATGNLEGTFRADWSTGDLVWVEDCHGDTYSVATTASAVYIAGHPHYCGTSGGFEETNPRHFSRGMAWSKALSGNTANNVTLGYASWAGTPIPNLLSWWPDFDTGSVSGSNQGPWSVAANNSYVVYGGEFTKVNNKPQQGLVRFAVKSIAPNADGPRLSGDEFAPTLNSSASGNVQVNWPTNTDRDNQYLDYQLVRDNVTIYTVNQGSRDWWDRPTLSYLDTGLAPGSTHSYKVRAIDPFGNTATGSTVSVTVASSGSSSDYSTAVLRDGAVSYWRLGESSGPTISDIAGANPGTAGAGLTFGQPGAISGDSNSAAKFSGTSTGVVTTANAYTSPNNFSIEAWFQTTTKLGGKIVGFGNSNTGDSTSVDRHIYMNTAGKVLFGVYSSQTLTSPTALNDGKWHHVVGTLSPTGMSFFVDGVQVGTRTDIPFGKYYTGYWRIGGDLTWSGGKYFPGNIDDVAIYGRAVPANVVAQHNQIGRTVAPSNTPPSSSFTASVTGSTVSVNGSASTDTDGTIASYAWNFGDGTTGTGATTTHAYATPGTYTVTLTVMDNGGATATSTKSVTITPNTPPSASFTTSVTGSTVSVNGSASTDTDGTIASYAWNFGDGTTGSQVTTTHTYADPGTYTVTLTVTDNSGGTDVTTKTVTAPNAAPTASFTNSVTNSTVSVDATGSADSDGSIASYAWNFGDATTGTGATTSHPYAAAGTYTVTLTVTDNSGGTDSDGSIASYAWNFGDATTGTGATTSHPYAAGGSYTVTLTVTDTDGATGTTSQTVTIAPAPNTPPTASFTNSVTGSTVSVDATGSADSDGTIASYAWNFGDATTGTGATTSHPYAAAGTYTVTLTVTDNSGGTDSTTRSVTIAPAPPAYYAADNFSRVTTNSWGSATTGGAWSLSSATISQYSVNDTGRLNMAAGRTTESYLTGAVAANSDITASVGIGQVPVGGNAYAVLIGRRVDGVGDYRARLTFAPSGALTIQVMRGSTSLKAVSVPGVTYAADDRLNIRLSITGGSPTTISARVWKVGTTEPTTWQVSASDSTAGLQTSGYVGLGGYISGALTSGPVLVQFDDFTAAGS